MKWIYRLFTIAMLAAALVGPFFMSNENGKPMLSLPTLDDFKPDQLIPNSFKTSNTDSKSSLPSSGSSSSTTVYKWKDEIGTWHYGDRPPTGGAEVSTLQIDSNTNIIQGLKIKPKEEAPKVSKNNSPEITPMPKKGENFLSMERAFNVLNDAKAVQGLMNKHNEQLKAMTGETSQ